MLVDAKCHPSGAKECDDVIHNRARTSVIHRIVECDLERTRMGCFASPLY